MEPDFSGYATKAGLKCSDGRTITPDAFKHMDGKQVPLVWQHDHSDPEKILGHVILRHVTDGMRSDAFFNDSAAGKAAKALVLHGDVKFLSIYANQLKEAGKNVIHGMIREVSLVLAGANPGALIDQVRVAHGADPEDVETLEDEAIIHTGLEIELPGKKDGQTDEVEHADGPTLQDVYDTLSDDQKTLVHEMVAAALEAQQAEDAAAQHADGDQSTGEGDKSLEHKEGTEVNRNVFDQSAGGTATKPVISHADVQAIFENGKKLGSFKEAINAYFLEHSDLLQHGVDNIDLLFPDAKMVMDTPEWDKRRTEWVSVVMNGTHKTPFSRIKTMTANLTLAAARAKGYVKGALKKEEFFGLTKRTTGPTTVYKKQSLDRDDILDITDFDIVAWLWGEIRLMLEEEVARAILLSDGRDVDDEDKIADPAGGSSGNGIRSILNDHDYYAQTLYVNLGSTPDYLLFIDEVIASRRFYKGTGLPTMFTTEVHIAKMLTLRSGLTGMRMYRDLNELASELRVSSIVPVEPMEEYPDVIAILVNLADYNVGTDKGGEISRFDDFDIDYNKFKYLMETRLSGALTKVKSALIYRSVASTDVLVVPNEPTFVSSTGVVTIVATTGVVYKNKNTGATLSTGAQSAIASGASITVVATPASGYYLADNISDEWTFTRD
jgi:hypothetical protein